MNKALLKEKAFFWITTLGDGLLDLVFPGNIYCICCGKPIDESAFYSLCPSCVRILSWANRDNCEKCGKPLNLHSTGGQCEDCRNEERPFEKGFTCVRYGHTERELVHELKYKEKPYLAAPFGQLMYERLAVECIDEDLIVPVPMSREKEKQRGYNQAALLAKAISKKQGKPCHPHLLKRIKDTTPMSRLSASERRENVQDVFALKKGNESMVSGKSVLLVDDVFTTGSTAAGCTEVLLDAGASCVYVMTFAAGADSSTKVT